jgi:hypothetical protein
VLSASAEGLNTDELQQADGADIGDRGQLISAGVGVGLHEHRCRGWCRQPAQSDLRNIRRALGGRRAVRCRGRSERRRRPRIRAIRSGERARAVPAAQDRRDIRDQPHKSAWTYRDVREFPLCEGWRADSAASDEHLGAAARAAWLRLRRLLGADVRSWRLHVEIPQRVRHAGDGRAGRIRGRHQGKGALLPRHRGVQQPHLRRGLRQFGRQQRRPEPAHVLERREPAQVGERQHRSCRRGPRLLGHRRDSRRRHRGNHHALKQLSLGVSGSAPTADCTGYKATAAIRSSPTARRRSPIRWTSSARTRCRKDRTRTFTAARRADSGRWSTASCLHLYRKADRSERALDRLLGSHLVRRDARSWRLSRAAPTRTSFGSWLSRRSIRSGWSSRTATRALARATAPTLSSSSTTR